MVGAGGGCSKKKKRAEVNILMSLRAYNFFFLLLPFHVQGGEEGRGRICQGKNVFSESSLNWIQDPFNKVTRGVVGYARDGRK